MRGAALTTASFVLTAAVVGHAYYQKKQFYPSVVYITKSNPSMAVSEKDFLLSLSEAPVKNIHVRPRPVYISGVECSSVYCSVVKNEVLPNTVYQL